MALICLSPFVLPAVIAGAVIWRKLWAQAQKYPVSLPRVVRNEWLAPVGLAAFLTGAVWAVTFRVSMAVPMYRWVSVVQYAFLAGLAGVPCYYFGKRISRRWPSQKRLLALFVSGVTAAVITLCFAFWWSSPVSLTSRILKAGKFAPLPKSASDVNAFAWAMGFGSGVYLSFHAEPEDIERFIAETPSLKYTEPMIFSPEHMHLPRPEDGGGFEHEYFYADSRPYWYDPTVKKKGRKYKNSPYGSVTINDETNMVYVEFGS